MPISHSAPTVTHIASNTCCSLQALNKEKPSFFRKSFTLFCKIFRF